jgi:hypothetical protein
VRAGEGVGHVGDVDEVPNGAAVAVDGDLGGVAVLDGEELGMSRVRSRSGRPGVAPVMLKARRLTAPRSPLVA